MYIIMTLLKQFFRTEILYNTIMLVKKKSIR